jgi:hypothetical protein
VSGLEGFVVELRLVRTPELGLRERPAHDELVVDRLQLRIAAELSALYLFTLLYVKYSSSFLQFIYSAVECDTFSAACACAYV